MKRQICNIPRNLARRLIGMGFVLDLLLALAITTVVYAQTGGDYDLSWSTIDNGGTISMGGEYALGGAVGQLDAGTLSGGNFELSGGFWNIKVQYPTIVGVISFIAHSKGFTWIALAVLLFAMMSLRQQKRSLKKRFYDNVQHKSCSRILRAINALSTRCRCIAHAWQQESCGHHRG